MNESTHEEEQEFSDLLLECLQSGATLKDLRGVSDDLLESVYTHAYRFYEGGQLEQAESFFKFLCLYDFYNGEYAMGLAAVYQMQKQYQRAIDMYALAFALTKDDYRPMFHVGQCQMALRNVSTAKECFTLVIGHCKDEALTQRARHYIEAINLAQAKESKKPTGE